MVHRARSPSKADGERGQLEHEIVMQRVALRAQERARADVQSEPDARAERELRDERDVERSGRLEPHGDRARGESAGGGDAARNELEGRAW